MNVQLCVQGVNNGRRPAFEVDLSICSLGGRCFCHGDVEAPLTRNMTVEAIVQCNVRNEASFMSHSRVVHSCPSCLSYGCFPRGGVPYVTMLNNLGWWHGREVGPYEPPR